MQGLGAQRMDLLILNPILPPARHASLLDALPCCPWAPLLFLLLLPYASFFSIVSRAARDAIAILITVLYHNHNRWY